MLVSKYITLIVIVIFVVIVVLTIIAVQESPFALLFLVSSPFPCLKVGCKRALPTACRTQARRGLKERPL